MPDTWSLDHAGRLSRRVEDAGLVLAVIAGHDPRDPASADVPVGDSLKDLKRGVRRMRIGVPRQHFFARIEGRVEAVGRQALLDLDRARPPAQDAPPPPMA